MRLTMKLLRDIASIALVSILVVAALLAFSNNTSAVFEEIQRGLHVALRPQHFGIAYTVAALYALLTFKRSSDLKTRGERYITAATPLIFYAGMIAYYLARTGSGAITIAIYGFVFVLIWIIGKAVFNRPPEE